MQRLEQRGCSQGFLQPPEPGKDKEGFSFRASRCSPAQGTPEFQTYGLQSRERIHFCCCKPPVCSTLSQQSRKLYRGDVIDPRHPVRSPVVFTLHQTKPFALWLGFPKTRWSDREEGEMWSPPSDVSVAAKSSQGARAEGPEQGRREVNLDPGWAFPGPGRAQGAWPLRVSGSTPVKWGHNDRG